MTFYRFGIEEDIVRVPQDRYDASGYSSSDREDTSRLGRSFPESPYSVNSSPPRPARPLLDPYTRQNNYIPPIRSLIHPEIIDDEREYGDRGANNIRLSSIQATGVPYSYNSNITAHAGYLNEPQWGDYVTDDDNLLVADPDYLSERPYPNGPSSIGSFNDTSSMAIVDSQGNVIHDLNGGWEVPHPLYNPEINRYIDHIRADPTKSLDEIKTLMENIRPDMEIPPEDREGTPPEMTYPLMEHQKLGLAWLKSMEEGSNKGGILADDMGLGKTIQALALLVSRRSTNDARKTTLILTPVALLKQWEREIKVKLKPDHSLKVCIHHGTSKKSKSFADLAKYDGKF